MNLLIFQHIPCEHPGSLRGFLDADQVQRQVVELDAGEEIPELEDYDALWVMGGPMDVWQEREYPWLRAEKAAIRRWVRQLRRPYLGLCLGHQLLADALGGSCAPQGQPEIGVMEVELTAAAASDPLFASLAPRQKVLQWHGAGVVRTPRDAVVLARSDACPVQAMRVGAHAWSMQYHVEVEADTVHNWSRVPAYREALEAALGPDALARFAAASAAHLPSFAASAATLFRNFMAALPPRPASLPPRPIL